jgi:hypothetical protein
MASSITVAHGRLAADVVALCAAHGGGGSIFVGV